MMKELFVFGAGASNASGRTPLGKNLIWDYFEDCSTLYEIGEGGKPAQHDLEKKKQEFSNFGLFLKSIEKKFPHISVHKDWLRCMDDAMMFTPRLEKLYYIDEIMGYLQNENDLKNIELIKRLTLEHIAKASFDSQNLLYKKFVQSLKGKSSTDVSIISFNFDCLLREDFKNQIYFDYFIDFKTVSPVRELSHKGEGIPLMKLNGSLDWVWHPKTKEISLGSFHITDRCYPYNLDPSDEQYIEPYIFLPHQKKGAIMNLVWAKAEERIQSASKITIIGYSFPKYDQDVIELFRNNLSPESTIEVVDISLVSKHEGLMRACYKSMFPQISKVNVYLDGFEGYVNRLTNAGFINI